MTYTHRRSRSRTNDIGVIIGTVALCILNRKSGWGRHAGRWIPTYQLAPT